MRKRPHIWMKVVVLFGSIMLVCQLNGCSVFRSMGIASTPEVQQRRGVAGSADAPFVLNPLIPHNLVLAGRECRYYQIQIPSHWYWKVMLTAATRDQGRSAAFDAELDVTGNGWKPVVPYESHKRFLLNANSSQGVVAIANEGPDRVIVLKICQEGPPIKVILESQVSPYGNALLAPPLKKTLDEVGH